MFLGGVGQAGVSAQGRVQGSGRPWPALSPVALGSEASSAGLGLCELFLAGAPWEEGGVCA